MRRNIYTRKWFNIVIPEDFWFSESNFQEYQDIVNTVGSVQFIDTWERFRFGHWVYIWNRTALDFQPNSNQMRIINLDTYSYTLKQLPRTMPNDDSFRIFYFWENRLLTQWWIWDWEGNEITSFSYDSITPWEPGVVWANLWYDIYKWIVENDNITFTKIGTSWPDQFPWYMNYWYLWAYLLNGNDIGTFQKKSAYIDPFTSQVTDFVFPGNADGSRQPIGVAWADWKFYRLCVRRSGKRWTLEKIGTTDEGIVGDSLGNDWVAYGTRFWKFLWNIVSWGMNNENGTWVWYWSNNYFIGTDWSLTKVQTNAWGYDSTVNLYFWFIDENWWIYPYTREWGTGVILKTDKTFTNLNWKNPYLWR